MPPVSSIFIWCDKSPFDFFFFILSLSLSLFSHLQFSPPISFNRLFCIGSIVSDLVERRRPHTHTHTHTHTKTPISHCCPPNSIPFDAILGPCFCYCSRTRKKNRFIWSISWYSWIIKQFETPIPFFFFCCCCLNPFTQWNLYSILITESERKCVFVCVWIGKRVHQI